MVNNCFMRTYWAGLRTRCEGRWTLRHRRASCVNLKEPQPADTWAAVTSGWASMKGNPVRCRLWPTPSASARPLKYSACFILQYLWPHRGPSGSWDAPPVQPLFRHAQKKKKASVEGYDNMRSSAVAIFTRQSSFTSLLSTFHCFVQQLSLFGLVFLWSLRVGRLWWNVPKHSLLLFWCRNNEQVSENNNLLATR